MLITKAALCWQFTHICQYAHNLILLIH